MLEKDFKGKVLKYLHKTYPKAVWYKISDKFISGIPDIIGCLEGKFIAIELKRKGNKPTALQEYNINAINVAGGLAFWTDNLEEIKEEIKWHSKNR